MASKKTQKKNSKHIKALKKLGSKFTERIHATFEKGALATKDQAAKLKPLSKKEQWMERLLTSYLSKTELRRVLNLQKQGKLRVDLERQGFSFMISGKDLIPTIKSRTKELRELNQIIKQRFYEERFKEFSSKAWLSVQEFIGSDVLGMRPVKQLIALMLVSEPIEIKVFNVNEEDASKLKNSVWELSDELVNQIKISKSPRIKKKEEFITLKAMPADLSKFEEMTEKILAESQTVVNKTDMEFLKTYVREARELNVILPKKLSPTIKNFVLMLKKNERKVRFKVTPEITADIINLAKASARLEMRKKIEAKDLERVFKILKPD